MSTERQVLILEALEFVLSYADFTAHADWSHEADLMLERVQEALEDD